MDVEQVGGGAAGYLLRQLRNQGAETTADSVDALDAEAETPGHAVYAAIEGPVVLGVALLRLPEQSVEVLGTALGRQDVREALVERARYDAAASGVADLHTI